MGLIVARVNKETPASPQPRQPQEWSISAEFAGEGNQSTSDQYWKKTVIWESFGPEPSITQTMTHLIGARDPLDPKRRSGRRHGRPKVVPEETIKAAQEYLKRELSKNPHWHRYPGLAFNRVVEFLKLDKKQAKSKRNSIRRHILYPVLGAPK